MNYLTVDGIRRSMRDPGKEEGVWRVDTPLVTYGVGRTYVS